MSLNFLSQIRGPLCLLLVFIMAGCSKPEQASVEEAPVEEAVSESSGQEAPAAAAPEEFAGTIFGNPVPTGNYYFAKRVHSIFHAPGEDKLSPAEKEKLIWHNLALHFEASRRKIEVTETEMSQWIDSIFTALEVPIKPSENPEAYRDWVEKTLHQDVVLFENQMRYLATIEKLKREMVKEMEVEVSDPEIEEEYLNIEKHVGGEYALFDSQAEAQQFYEGHQNERKWKKFKESNPDTIKPFHLITLQAIIDLWGVPKDQIHEFHSLRIGSVGKPLPFGMKWGVFRLLEKRDGDLANLTEDLREQYRKRVEAKKQYEARNQWIEDLYGTAQVQVWVQPEEENHKDGNSAPAEIAD